MRTYGAKALGLTVMAALGLMTFSASSALAVNLNVIMEPQTSVVGFFKIGAFIKPIPPAGETIEAKGPGGRLVIPARGAEIDCTEWSLSGGPFIENEYKDWNLLVPGPKEGGHGVTEATFTGCKVFATNAEGVKGAELPACSAVVKSEGQAVGTIVAKGLIRIVRHPEGANEKAFVVLEPKVINVVTSEENTGLVSKFTKLAFGGLCVLPAAADIHGGLVIRAPNAQANKPGLAVKSWEVAGGAAVLSAEQALLGAQLKFGVNQAFVEANNIVAELTGPNAAEIWGMM